MHVTLLARWVFDRIGSPRSKSPDGRPFLLHYLIPFYAENGTWWTTKGNHVFSVPDFALWIENELQPEQVRNLLYYMFDYIRGVAKVLPGERIGMGKTASLQVGRVSEYQELLEGEGETLTLRFA